MDSIYPYRVAWQAPKAVDVSPESRRAILEALEYEFPTSRRRLASLTDLGDVTFRRGCRQLIREKVMALKYGQDPDSGKSCDLVTFEGYPVLPVLELSEAYMVWRLGNTLGESVFATVRDRGGFCTAEDDLYTLMGQVSSVLRAGTCRIPKDVPLQPPVLLLPSPMNTPAISHAHTLPREPERLATLVHRVLDMTPSHILTSEEAVAHELYYHPAVRGADCVLHLRFGVTDTATLFIRQNAADVKSPLIPAPYAAEMNRALRETLDGTTPHSASRPSRIAEFLCAVCRFITPQLVVIEAPDTISVPDGLSNHPQRPPQTTLLWMPYALNTPSLAHRGALRFSRRVLWERMESKSPQSTHE